METVINKVLASLKNGSFMGKAHNKIAFSVYRLLTGNANAATYVRQCAAYRRLSQEFRDIIRSAKENGWNPNPSNKVWVCWLQGFEDAPPLVQACCRSLKRNLPDREIVLLTEENLPDYIQLPDYILTKYRARNIGRAHYSDLLRVSLLCEYGGLWADATVLCTAPEFGEFLKTQPLFVFKKFDLTRADIDPIIASSWLISSYPQHCVLTLTRDLLYAYWKKSEYPADYFIFHIFFALAARHYQELWDAVPAFNNHSPHTMGFELGAHFTPERWKQLLKMSDFHKLNHHISYSARNTIYGQILEKYGHGGGTGLSSLSFHRKE